MIPKTIHYCWFGRNPLPELAQRCIASWRKYLPDYDIKEWNESNFDVNIIPYTAEAYTAKKYAFVSDYARFWILYKYGGLYFDTDVEVIRPIEDIIEKGAFMGYENGTNMVAPGLGLGVEKQHPIYKELLDEYNTMNFLHKDGKRNLKTVVQITSDCLRKYESSMKGHIEQIQGIDIYPKDYFCPISVEDGKLRITENTRTIHHYAASWVSPWHSFMRKWVLRIGGYRLKKILSRTKQDNRK